VIVMGSGCSLTEAMGGAKAIMRWTGRSGFITLRGPAYKKNKCHASSHVCLLPFPVADDFYVAGTGRFLAQAAGAAGCRLRFGGTSCYRYFYRVPLRLCQRRGPDLVLRSLSVEER